MPPRRASQSREATPINPNPNLLNRETSPMPLKQVKKLINGLNQGEYARLGQLPNRPINNHRRLRNALILGGLGALSGVGYRFQQPLMKLGTQAYNYAKDKFHNLFQPANTTATNTHPHIY